MTESADSLVVIAICGDPGGANAIAPVIEVLRAEGRVTVQALAYLQGCDLWTKRNIKFDEVPENIPKATIVDILRGQNVKLLLVGTSLNPVELEKQFIAAANDIGLPSLAVLDFWSNYGRRFSDADGNLVYIPDLIAVMDERARDEMMAEGFDPEQLVIAGQPAFDDLVMWRSRFTSAKRQAIRNALGAGSGELLILFASQPLSVLYGTDPQNPLYPGYTEQEVLRTLVNALDHIAEQSGQKIVLAIRPHPRERVESFNTVKCRTAHLVLSTDGESRDIAMASDLVIGMNTVLLVEACYLGCLVVSLQPGLRIPDPLPTNRSGLSRPVYHEHEVIPVLEQMLLDNNARRYIQAKLSNFQPDGCATKRVVELVYRMIKWHKDMNTDEYK